MSQDMLVFTLAAMLILAEALSHGMHGHGPAPQKITRNRIIASALLTAGAAFMWKAGWMSGHMAATAAVLLVAESCLLSMRRSEGILAKVGVCALALVVLASSLWAMVLAGTIESRWKPRPDMQIAAFEKIKMDTISKLAAEKFAGANAILITADFIPFYPPEQIPEMLRSFGEALAAGKVKVAAEIKVPVDMSKKGRRRFQFDAEWLDNQIMEHRDCPLVISFLGLPQDYSQMKSLTGEDTPAFILVNQFWPIGDDDLRRLLKEERIAAYVRPKNNWWGAWGRNPVMPKDEKTAFQQRYVLMTPENVK